MQLICLLDEVMLAGGVVRAGDRDEIELCASKKLEILQLSLPYAARWPTSRPCVGCFAHWTERRFTTLLPRGRDRTSGAWCHQGVSSLSAPTLINYVIISV